MFDGTGRRKESVARVFLRAGTGKFTVNGRTTKSYFPNHAWEHDAVEPLKFTSLLDQVDVVATAKGGGVGGVRNGWEESLLTHSIEGLDNDGEFDGAIHVVTLSKDSSFYRQQGKFERQDGFSTFKRSFLHEMFDAKKSPYHWPKRIDLQSWKADTADIISRVHRDFFQAKDKLTLDERKDFIEVAYTKFVEALIDKISPETCNLSCKGCVDRGANALALLYIDHLKMSQKNFTPRRLDKIVALANVPAVLACNRPPIEERVQRLNGAARRILAH